MTKTDALRRALVLLDELAKLVDDFYPYPGPTEVSRVESVRLPLINALHAAEYDVDSNGRVENPPTQDSVVLGVLQRRWTAWLATYERESQRGSGAKFARRKP